eukprot:29614-Pelagococcus_subviridis.AAC.3
MINRATARRRLASRAARRQPRHERKHEPNHRLRERERRPRRREREDPALRVIQYSTNVHRSVERDPRDQMLKPGGGSRCNRN